MDLCADGRGLVQGGACPFPSFRRTWQPGRAGGLLHALADALADVVAGRHVVARLAVLHPCRRVQAGPRPCGSGRSASAGAGGTSSKSCAEADGVCRPGTTASPGPASEEPGHPGKLRAASPGTARRGRRQPGGAGACCGGPGGAVPAWQRLSESLSASANLRASWLPIQLANRPTDWLTVRRGASVLRAPIRRSACTPAFPP